MARAHFLVSVGGRIVTGNFLPYLISVSITQSTEQTADTAQFVLDDSAGVIRFPKTGESVHVELGWVGGAIRRFDGEVDTPSWETSRGSGSVLSVTARSVALAGKAVSPRERHWQKKPLSTILADAGKEAGISMQVSAGLSGVTPDFEMQDSESFFAFGERLAREHDAIFRVSGTKGVFIERGASLSGVALSTVAVTRGVNLISASGFAPTVDRPRRAKQTETWYDLDKAARQAKAYETGDDVESDDQESFSAPDEASAGTRSKAKGKKGQRDKGKGTVVINGAPEAQPGGQAILAGVRAGVDGTYTNSTVSDELSRSSGYTTTLTLDEPQGSAGTDGR